MMSIGSLRETRIRGMEVSLLKNAQIGNVIRSIRKSKGITATFVAQKIGYKSVSSYTRLEKGQTAITLNQAKKIADTLKVDINEFFNEKNLLETSNKTA